MNEITDNNGSFMTGEGPFKLLILGGGAVVQEYYLPALQALGWSESALVVEPSGATLATLHQRYPQVAIWQIDYNTILAQSKAGQIAKQFDAAIVALPNWLHEEAVTGCLKKGLHVICEKPLALTAEACQRMQRTAAVAQRVLAVGMVRRLLPSFGALREVIEKGMIGALVGIDIEDGGPYAWLSDSGAFFRPANGGVLADMGVHYLDLVESIVGPLVPIRATDDSRGGVEANSIFELATQQGIPVRLVLSRTRVLRNTAIFKGTLGEVAVEKSTFGSCVWHSYNTRITATVTLDKPFVSGTWEPSLHSCFIQQFIDFAGATRGNNSTYVTAQDAESTIRLIEWANHQQISSSITIQSSQAFAPGSTVVTGGTGFIGVNLVERLSELGFDDITVPVRHYRTCAEVARFPVALPRLNLLDYESVKAALRGKRWIFHLAYGREGDQAAQVTIEGTRNVVEAAIAEQCEAVVVLSTMYVFGQPAHATVDETWPYQPYGGEYGTSKAHMERWCLQRSRSSGSTRIIVLNPSCVYGPYGKTYTTMPLQMAQRNQFCWIDDGRGGANYTYVSNLVDAMLLAAACHAAHGERFIINDGTTTWRTFLSPLLGCLADQLPSYSQDELYRLNRNTKRPSMLDVARTAVANQQVIDVLSRTAAFHYINMYAPGFISRVRAFRRASSNTTKVVSMSGTPLLPPDWLAELFGPTTTAFSSAKAQRVLGWTPEVPLTVGLACTIEWLQSINLYPICESVE